ncbi:MAG TPA: serine/threonine-protein kinase [Terriglobales bacterium]|nr:serine/threonine-protein kinase [Terriglobales bacterium]
MSAMKDLGGYELHEKIGSGAMASVYLGVQKSLDRRVVLKVLYPHLAEDEKLVARFEREARAAAMLRHENIVQVIDCGKQDDVFYIAMEFVEGMDLKKWQECWGAPPVEVALLLLHGLACGLEHAHQHRIIHRDIKPANIMLTPDGRVKIMDFGLARRGDETTLVTVAGSVLGTPAYMSPEQAAGESTVDARSDIFSAGVVGYELLGGARPFPGDSYSTVLRAILTVEPPSLDTLNPLVPPEAVAVVQRMLQKDPARRYQDMGQVRHDIEALLEQMGLVRWRDFLREYAVNPKETGETLRRKRLQRHLDQGIYFENMGLGKIDDALLEFRRVLHLDPKNKVASEHLRKLERERTTASASAPAEAAPAAPVIPDPERTLVMPPGGPPSAPTAAAAPAPAPAPARPAPAPAPAHPAPPAAAPAQPRPAPARPAPAPARPMPRGAARPADRTRVILLGAAALLVVVIAVLGISLLRKPKPRAIEPVPPVAQRMVVPPTPAPPVEAPKLPAQTPLPKGEASLAVSTNPADATVSIDGRAQDMHSNAVYRKLVAGRHAVKVEKSGFEPARKRVTLEAGKQAELSFVLEALPQPAPGPPPPPAAADQATVVVSAAPFANYFVDDKPAGTNLPSITVQLLKGRHVIRAVHPTLGSREWSVNLKAGETMRLSHDFIASNSGSIRVGASVWAYVVLDGKETGKTTPCVLVGITPGAHTISLVRRGFVVQGGPKTVTVTAGNESPVDFALVAEGKK